ncbi:hypothetical protein, conserved [Entamoeba dispar SAW760]|uniref:Uncharacterized protein n=1 Tax=Entamoeba dispar (strain ATCC PRA-260 / SAW760) TaxID=370354 RepID=B0ERS9_ENTDS|nr:uncharacterized protein EDI_336230 [Entamoeba dispar SAW760]EDR22724.1 hypothetical protein, conserved [Entamoeba dispar SAW760]|eukprot:EDR22724.1 hypothetical protein, conserved [Entamoeba dispar SAW760]
MEEYNDENDPIELEMPVYLCDNNEQELFLMQYPTRLAWRPFDLSQVKEVRYKPIQKGIEMDVKLETDFIDEESIYKITSQTYKGTVTENKANYAVGFVKEVKKQPTLVLFPVSTIAQMRPQLQYIDEDIIDEKPEKAEGMTADGKKKKIAVSAAPTKKQKDLEQLKKDEAEEAIKMKLNDTTENETIEVVEKMIKTSKGKIEWENDVKEYINKLAPLIEQPTPLLQNRDRIIDTLRIGKIMKLSRITEILKSSESTLTGWLAELCYLVNGALVLKGEFIQEIGERENCIREIILSTLSLKKKVKMEDIEELWPNYTQRIKMVRKVFDNYCTIIKPEYGEYYWVAKVEDEETENEWTTLAQSSKQHWKTVKEGVIKRMKELDIEGDEFSFGKIIIDKKKVIGSLNQENQEPLSQLLKELLMKEGAMKISSIIDGVKKETKRKTSKLYKQIITQEIIEATLEPISYHIGSVYVGKKCPKDKNENVRNAILQFVIEKQKFTQQELRTHLQSIKFNDSNEIISLTEIKRHVSEFMEMHGNIWTMKNGDIIFN